MDKQVTLVIFTCQGREHLLQRSYASFKQACEHHFDKTILAIDGPADPKVIKEIAPDLVVHHTKRSGYVSSIAKTVKLIDTPYFFWLEDDWAFHRPLQLHRYLVLLQNNTNWAEIIYSQFGPLKDELKIHPLGDNLYQTTFGFSANPAICNTEHVRSGFGLLERSPKGDTLGEDGFENFLTKTFKQQNIKCVIIDPCDHIPISHEGYLESTPRNWHMTNSLEERTQAHLLTIPAPSFARKCNMVLKLIAAFFSLGIGQFTSNKVYEYCFRVIASAKTINKDE